MKLARIRKTLAATVGMAVTLVLLVPQESIPERWRPVVGGVLALGTVFGVYKIHNAPVKTVAPTLFARRPVKGTDPRDPPSRTSSSSWEERLRE